MPGPHEPQLPPWPVRLAKVWNLDDLSPAHRKVMVAHLQLISKRTEGETLGRSPQGKDRE